uniref:Uncharacterized protein n=1 Tax=Physcomitrium patens TaxID=3218 RepID=A0A2K1JS30_PHYPA|nr:hypothetical protein PHYPA_016726 [Physcomitrium patens]
MHQFNCREDVAKFINASNKIKKTNIAAKEGAQLQLIKPPKGISKVAP